MSRRKNFGEGYGYKFHGAFSKKEDAVKKESKTPGSFIKGSLTPRGYRWIVMSPRDNPVRRRRNVAKPKVKDYHVVSEITGKRIRKATMVTLPDGRVHKFLEKLPKRLAIKEALRHLGIGHNPCMVGENPIRYEVVEHDANDKARTLRSGLTQGEARDALKKLRVAYGSYGVRFTMKRESAKNPAELIVLGANPRRVRRNAGEDQGQGEVPGSEGRWWSACPEHGNDLYPSGSCHECAMLAPPFDTGSEQVNPQGETKTFDTSTLKGLKDAERYKARLENKYDKVTTDSVGFDRVRITGNFADVRQRFLRANPRQNVEFGEYEHGIFHPWTRRTRTRRKPAKLRRNSENAAADLRETFVGKPAEWIDVSDEPHMPAGDYAQLGELLALYVKPCAGGQVQHIAFRGDRPAVVAAASARQIYFVAGDQDVSGSLEAFGAIDRGGGIYELGELRRIDYKQRKEHVPDPDVDEWRHELGEETGERPLALFDAGKKRILLEGGAYEVRAEGIVN